MLRPTRKPDEKLSDERLGEPSADIRERVEAARERQRGRFEGTSLMSNAVALACARVGPGEVRDYCQVDEAGRNLLRAAMQQRPEGTRMSAHAVPREKAGPFPQGFRWNPPDSEAGTDDCRPDGE